MSDHEVTITAWPADSLVVQHQPDPDAPWPLRVSFDDAPRVAISTDPEHPPQVDLRLGAKDREPIPLCFSLCEPICARSDYSIGVTIFDNPVARIRIVGETRVEAASSKVGPEPGQQPEPLAVWHSVNSAVHHNNPDCNTGNNIETENIRPGTGDRPLCAECRHLAERAAAQ